MTMTPSAQRVAGLFERTAGPKNPHLPKDLLKQLVEMQKLAKKLRDGALDAKAATRVALGAAEVEFAEAQEAWVKDGNHPDDFTDARLSLDGAQRAQAREWLEALTQVMRPAGSVHDGAVDEIQRFLDDA